MDIIKIEDIQALCSSGKIIWSSHCAQRLVKRNIGRNDVKNVLMNGKIIEQYPTDYPYPSCLMLGVNLNQHFLHIVCATGNDVLIMITAYYPSAEKWESDFQTRKERTK